MRNERTRSRTIRKRIGKCRGIFRAFNEIQLRYAEKLDQMEDIKTIECNVRLVGLSIGEGYTSDLVCAKEDGSLMVRETVQRKHLLRPSTARLLDASREYWLSKGAKDWGSCSMSDFYSGEGRLLRIIKREGGRVLVVDCLKKTMPEWVGEATLDAFEAADESAAKERLGA